MIIDKIDAHQAFDLDQDLLELAKAKQYKIDTVVFKIIFTTNLKGEYEGNQMDEQ